MALTSGLTNGLTNGLKGTQVSGEIAWTPANGDAYLWFDPNDTTTTTIAAGKLTSFASKIGTGVLATNGSDPNEPTTVGTGLMVDNSGGEGYLVATDAYTMALTTSAAAIGFSFACCISDPTSGFRTAVNGVNGVSSGIILIRGGITENMTLSVRENDSTNLAQTNSPNGSASVGNYVISGQVVAGTGALKELYINGSPVNTGTDTITWDATPLTALGYLATSNGSNRWDCQMGTLVLYKVAKSSAERDKCDGYIARQYGFQTLFPDDHPYRYDAPMV